MYIDYFGFFLCFSSSLLVLFLGISTRIILSRQLRRKKATDELLRENGIPLSGTIVTCFQKKWMADLKFTYEVQGNQYSRTQHVPQETYNMVHAGDPVVLLYDSQDPQKALLRDVAREYVEIHSIRHLYFLGIGLGVGIVGLLIITLIAVLLSRFFPS